MTQSDRPLSALAHQACKLASLIEALDVLEHESSGPEDCPIATRARNSMGIVIEACIEKAWALNEAIEAAGKAQHDTRADQAQA